MSKEKAIEILALLIDVAIMMRKYCESDQRAIDNVWPIYIRVCNLRVEIRERIIGRKKKNLFGYYGD